MPFAANIACNDCTTSSTEGLLRRITRPFVASCCSLQPAYAWTAVARCVFEVVSILRQRSRVLLSIVPEVSRENADIDSFKIAVVKLTCHYFQS